MRVISRLRVPTRRGDWRLLIRTVRLVLSIPPYAVLAVVYALLALSTFVFVRNLAVLRQVILFGSLPLDDRVQVLVGMYPGFGSAYTLEGTIVLVATGVLVGINLAMVTYHVREHRLSLGGGSGGVGGVVLGTLGGGCAACGSAVLAGISSMAGASGILIALPLDGLEFALLAIVTLVVSLYWMADGMRGGEIAVCPVDVNSAGVD